MISLYNSNELEVNECIMNRELKWKTDFNWNVIESIPLFNKYRLNSLIEWIMMTSNKLDIDRQTYYASISICFKFCSKYSNVTYNNLLLIGATSLFIANKFYSENNISICNILLCTRCSYTFNDMISMEKIILNTLKWNINVVTCIDWVDIYIKNIGFDIKDKQSFYYIEYMYTLIDDVFYINEFLEVSIMQPSKFIEIFFQMFFRLQSNHDIIKTKNTLLLEYIINTYMKNNTFNDFFKKNDDDINKRYNIM